MVALLVQSPLAVRTLAGMSAVSSHGLLNVSLQLDAVVLQLSEPYMSILVASWRLCFLASYLHMTAASLLFEQPPRSHSIMRMMESTPALLCRAQHALVMLAHRVCSPRLLNNAPLQLRGERIATSRAN